MAFLPLLFSFATMPVPVESSTVLSGTLGLGAFLFLGFALAACRGTPRDDRPNIVLIMADDLGFSDLGSYGGEIRTPEVDRLASNGLRFTQFYNTGRCSPTRASLLTGLYPQQTGVGWLTPDLHYPGYRGDLNNECVTIAEVLNDAGYATYMVGKWHLTHHMGHWTGDEKLTSRHSWPLQRGFEGFYGVFDGTENYFDPNTLTRDNTPISREEEDYYITDAISRNASRFIAEHVREKPQKPFFLYVAYTAPHLPLHTRREDMDRYRGWYNRGWDIVRAERHRHMIEEGIVRKEWPLTPRDKLIKPWDDVENKPWQAARMEAFAAVIDRMDQGIGQILSTLKEKGNFENSLIFFLSDNGGTAEELRAGWQGQRLWLPGTTRNGRPVRFGNDPEVLPGPETSFQSYGRPWANLSNTPFRLYKKWVHEGGISTPLIVHWTRGLKVSPGALTHEPGHVVYIMATCIDVTGSEYPTHHNGRRIHPLEGESLLPTLRSKTRSHGPIFWEHEGNRALREGKWKLVSRFPDRWELYDIENDRTEMHDLATAHPERVKKMKAIYAEWAQRSRVLPWPWDERDPMSFYTEKSPISVEEGPGYLIK